MRSGLESGWFVEYAKSASGKQSPEWFPAQRPGAAGSGGFGLSAISLLLFAPLASFADRLPLFPGTAA